MPLTFVGRYLLARQHVLVVRVLRVRQGLRVLHQGSTVYAELPVPALAVGQAGARMVIGAALGLGLVLDQLNVAGWCLGTALVDRLRHGGEAKGQCEEGGV
jgi:hypothetical protein